MILNAFLLALRQIRKNVMRAFLTMLGIIIGVSSVILIVSLGNGTSQMITNQISSLGNNVLLLVPSRRIDVGNFQNRRFSLKEADLLRERMPALKAVAPLTSSNLVLRYMQKNTQAQVIGMSKDYLVAGNWELQDGREFSDADYRAGTNVCILGDSVRKQLIDENSSPLGARIKMGNIVCEVTGVLKSKGQAMGTDQDNIVFVPMKTFQRSVSVRNNLYIIGMIMIAVQEGADSTIASDQVLQTMKNIRNVKEGDKVPFEVMDTNAIQETLSKTTGVLTLFLGAIAGISLLVGGIGIMNIMLVSVTERTREIGTRLAIGALQKEVLLQFLIEATTISSIGGIIGIVLSFFLVLIISSAMDIPFAFSVSMAFNSFIFSCFIGVLFGYLPARRASRLNPIDALRHE